MQLEEEIQGIPCFVTFCVIFIKSACCIVTVAKRAYRGYKWGGRLFTCYCDYSVTFEILFYALSGRGEPCE